MRTRILAFGLLVVMQFASVTPSNAVASGGRCSVAQSRTVVGGKLLTCTKVGKSLKWVAQKQCTSVGARLTIGSNRYNCQKVRKTRLWVQTQTPAAPDISRIVAGDTGIVVDALTPIAGASTMEISVDGGLHWTSSSSTSTATVTALTPATTYRVVARGRNSYGAGWQSPVTLVTTRTAVTHATLRFHEPTLDPSSVYESLSDEKTWSVDNHWYSNGLRVWHVPHLAGTSLTITVEATDQQGAPMAGRDVGLRVNKGFSNSTATFVTPSGQIIPAISGPTDGAQLHAVTDGDGIATFTLTNTTSTTSLRPLPVNGTVPRGAGVVYGQLAPFVVNDEMRQTIDIIEMGFYRTLASPTTPAVAGHTIGSLLWQDDFTGATGAAPNTAWWTRRQCGHAAENGGGSCYNNEQQYFAPSHATISQDAAGSLAIVTDHIASGIPTDADAGTCLSDSGTCNFVGARLDTQGKVSFQYGYIEARIATPVGGANWPAFWMLGDNITTVAWPNSGEIDIMEGKGATPSLSTGAAHYNLDPSGCCGGNRYIDGLTSTGAPFPGNWHTYAIAWKPGWMQFLVDETPFLTVDRTTAGITYWPFDAPFFAILNNAIGPAGGFGGNYDGWAQSRMLVDYVRAFQFDGYGVVTTHP